MQRIFLIGYMGAGKTTLGSPLATALGLSFIDLDKFIEKRFHKSVRAIFAEYGESRFREIEQQVLIEVSQFEDIVISTGGGTPCFFDNMELMNQLGTTVFLEVSLPVLFNRLKQGKHKRPILKNKDDVELLDFIRSSIAGRLPVYQKCQLHFNADLLDNEKEVAISVQKLISLLQS